MSDLDLEPKPTPVPPIVYIGRDKTLTVKVRTANGKIPVGDLGSASEIDCIFINADSSCLHMRLTTSGIVVTDPQFWEFQILLTAAQTALLLASPAGAFTDIESYITLGGRQLPFVMSQAVQILPRRFPNC